MSMFAAICPEDTECVDRKDILYNFTRSQNGCVSTTWWPQPEFKVKFSKFKPKFQLHMMSATETPETGFQKQREVAESIIIILNSIHKMANISLWSTNQQFYGFSTKSLFKGHKTLWNLQLLYNCVQSCHITNTCVTVLPRISVCVMSHRVECQVSLLCEIIKNTQNQPMTACIFALTAFSCTDFATEQCQKNNNSALIEWMAWVNYKMSISFVAGVYTRIWFCQEPPEHLDIWLWLWLWLNVLGSYVAAVFCRYVWWQNRERKYMFKVGITGG
jgi:hypothetical protein